MGDSLGVLQYVCHFFEKDSVLSLNLRVPLYTRLIVKACLTGDLSLTFEHLILLRLGL